MVFASLWADLPLRCCNSPCWLRRPASRGSEAPSLVPLVCVCVCVLFSDLCGLHWALPRLGCAILGGAVYLGTQLGPGAWAMQLASVAAQLLKRRSGIANSGEPLGTRFVQYRVYCLSFAMCTQLCVLDRQFKPAHRQVVRGYALSPGWYFVGFASVLGQCMVNFERASDSDQTTLSLSVSSMRGARHIILVTTLELRRRELGDPAFGAASQRLLVQAALTQVRRDRLHVCAVGRRRRSWPRLRCRLVHDAPVVITS